MNRYLQMPMIKPMLLIIAFLGILPAYGMMGRLRTGFQKVQQATSAGTNAWTNLPQAKRAQILVVTGCATAAAGCFAAHTLAREEAHAGILSVTAPNFEPSQTNKKQMNMEVRQLTPAEWPVWKTFYLAAVEENPVYFGERYEVQAKKLDPEWKRECNSVATLNEETQNMVFCISHEGKDVGIVAFQALRIRHNRFGFIKVLYIAPEYRRCGVAKKVINTVVRQAKKWNLQYIECTVHQINEPALQFWDNYGFKTTGTSGDYWIKKLSLEEITHP